MTAAEQLRRSTDRARVSPGPEMRPAGATGPTTKTRDARRKQNPDQSEQIDPGKREDTCAMLDPPVSGRLPAARPSANLRGNETVLVVDDEPISRGVMVHILQRFGYRVLETSAALEAQHWAAAT